MKASKRNIMIVLPPALRMAGMLKSPPLDIANLTGLLKIDPKNVVFLTDFRKLVVNDYDFSREQGIELECFHDFKRCLRHFINSDPIIDRNVERLLAQFDLDSMDYVVFSVMVLEQFSLPHLLSSLCLAQYIKKIFPKKKIVLFGNCPDFHIEKIMRLFKFIDAFPSQGNEAAVSKYISLNAGGKCEGVYCRYRGQLIVPAKSYGVNLDTFSVPDFSLFDLEAYQVNGKLVLPYELSRETINSFFYFYYIHKGTFILRSSKKAVSDLMILNQRHNTDLFHFMDVAINMNPKWLNEFCERLIECRQKIKWCALALPNIKKPLLDKIKAAGCVQLRWGVEYGSQRMLKNINQGTSKESIKDSLSYAHSIGINNYITLVSGLEGELEDDIQETREFLQEIAPFVDSAKECLYGELGHFSLGVFESFMSHTRVTISPGRYRDVLLRQGISDDDIIEFLTRQDDVSTTALTR